MTNSFGFTKPAIEALPFAEQRQRQIYHDTNKQSVGLQLRVTGTAKTFFVQKRVEGSPQRITLGRFPELTIEQARKQAARVLGQIAQGVNPISERKRQKLDMKTLTDVLEDYLITRKQLKPRTKQDMLKTLKMVCPDWFDLPLNKITSDMVTNATRRTEKAEVRRVLI